MENLGEFIDSQKAGLEILEACRTRLLVGLSRYAESMEPTHKNHSGPGMAH